MTGRNFLLSALAALHLAGCGSGRMGMAAGYTPPSTPVSPAGRSPVTARLQKAESEPQRPDIQKTTFATTALSVPGEPAVKIRAHVNGVAILDSEVREATFLRLRDGVSQAELETVKRLVLQQLIDREVVLQDAFERLKKVQPRYLDKLKQAGGKEFGRVLRAIKTSDPRLKTDEDVKNLLRSKGLSLDGFRRQVEREFMYREYLRSRIYPIVDRLGHHEIVEYYERQADEFQVPDSVKWQDLFIDASKFPTREEARRLAEELAGRARAGEDFSRLLQYDNGDSSYRNGEGFGQRRGEIRPVEAEPVLFQMREGEVGPPIELPTGFHVIRLVKRTHAGRMPLDEKAQAEIRKKLQNQIADREAKRLIADLTRNAAIEITGEKE